LYSLRNNGKLSCGIPNVFAQHTLCLAPEILDTVDVIAVPGKLGRRVDAHMTELARIQRIIAAEVVGANGAVRRYFQPDYQVSAWQ
jgi:hypothetical protein